MGQSGTTNIKSLIDVLLVDRGFVTTGDLASASGLTPQACHLRLRALVRAGELERVGAGRSTRYRRIASWFRRYPTAGLMEDAVWRDLAGSSGAIEGVPDPTFSILQYAVTEMVNNAIDHSTAAEVTVTELRLGSRIRIEVADEGVGIFDNVREKLGLGDNFAALAELTKGKTTTQPDRHSGQGVFFTSKAVDLFVADSGGIRMTVDNLLPDVAVGTGGRILGTLIAFELHPTTKRTLKSVFDAFSDPDDYAFSRTRVPLKLFRTGEHFVSRSEAKRLAANLERFADVEIDFAGVQDVGQGFVDELFRVWAAAHPGTRITPVNMNPAVEWMVRRSLA